MSALRQKRTCAQQKRMSSLPNSDRESGHEISGSEICRPALRPLLHSNWGGGAAYVGVTCTVLSRCCQSTLASGTGLSNPLIYAALLCRPAATSRLRGVGARPLVFLALRLGPKMGPSCRVKNSFGRSVFVLAHWRRGRDSNPRYPCEYAAFRVRCFQPLSHLSGARNGPEKATNGRRYVTKGAKTDKGRGEYIAPSSINPAMARRGDA
jgi:hypothetical protein